MRKPISVATTLRREAGNIERLIVTVVCDDGTMWSRKSSESEWHQLDTPPAEDPAEDVPEVVG